MAGATEIRAFTVTCPAGTLQSAPQVTNIAMPPRVVEDIRIRIPPGPNGVMGFAVGAAGVTVIPAGRGTFIVASDEVIDWPVPGQINSGAWQVQMYNTGLFDHSIYLQFRVHLPDIDSAASTAQPVDVEPVTTVGGTIPDVPVTALPPPPELVL